MLELLEKLVWFHTTADDEQSTFEALDYVSSFLIARGMYVRRFESNGRGSLVATIQPDIKKTKVMLAAHLDVIPAPEEMFAVHREDGRLYGRGVLDMKFAIAAYMQLVDELQDSLTEYDFGIMITTDEELAGRDGTRLLLEEGYIPDVCVLPDGGNNWQIQTFSKGFLFFILRSFGTAAHGSRPWLGKSATIPLLQALVAIQAVFTNSSEDGCTLNIGKISGGSAINQVPDYAEAQLDIRFMNEAERDELLRKVRGICEEHGVEVEIHAQGATTSFDLDNQYIAPFAKAITEVTGIEVTGSHTSGTNDCQYFAPYGVPCISIYPPGAGHHGPNEYIEEQAFYQFKDIVRLYLDRVAKTTP